jgi:tetratricopeptide (TPR) repeat protein
MRVRTSLIFLLMALPYGVPLFADDLSTLMRKGREAFQSGNFADAERYHRLALEESERAGDAVQRGEALSDLGGVLLARGRHAEAKTVCLSALEALRNAASKRYLPVVLNNLGALSTENEEFVEAESYLTESLRVIDELNPREAYRARVLNNLGVLHYATKNYKRAEKDFRQAIGVLDRERGPNSSDLAPLLNNLVAVYVAQKKWDAAATVFNRALSLSTNFSGLHLASVLDSAGTMHSARGKYGEAEEAFRRSYQLRLDILGKAHPAVASSAANLATALSAAGQYSEAENLLKDSLQVYEKTFGSQSLQVLVTLEKLAEIFRKTRREEEAVLMVERAKDIRFERSHVVRANALR